MRRTHTAIVFAMLALGGGVVVRADEPPGVGVPVLSRAPACEHEKLGSVNVAEGTEVSAYTKQVWLPSASYARAFERLGAAAAQRGANAVVLRMHEATFFTMNGRRSQRPVHVQLRGGALRLPESGCEFDAIDPADVLDRALRGEPFDVPTAPPMRSTAAS